MDLTAITLNTVGLTLLITLSRKIGWLNLACGACFVGIWTEKGMGLIIPGFVPSPLGQVVEYLPTLNETLVCLGIWAFGALLFSWLLHVAVRSSTTGARRPRTGCGPMKSETRMPKSEKQIRSPKAEPEKRHCRQFGFRYSDMGLVRISDFGLRI